MPLKRRYRLRGSETKQLVLEVDKRFEGVGRLLKGGAEVMELEDGREIILTGGRGVLFRAPEGFFPVLTALDLVPLRRVVVDMGAVPHVANGADIMAPGVVSADLEIKAEETVVVVDERHGKPLAVGLALHPGAELKGPKGKAVKNLHHVGDEVWGLLQEKVK